MCEHSGHKYAIFEADFKYMLPHSSQYEISLFSNLAIPIMLPIKFSEIIKCNTPLTPCYGNEAVSQNIFDLDIG